MDSATIAVLIMTVIAVAVFAFMNYHSSKAAPKDEQPDGPTPPDKSLAQSERERTNKHTKTRR